MKLNKSRKIHEAASKGLYSRYAFHLIQVSIDAKSGEPYLRATDGKILAIIPCEKEDGDGFKGGELIPQEHLVEAFKGSKDAELSLRMQGDADNLRIIAQRDATKIEGRPGEGDFPNLESIIPEELDTDIVFTFDADALLRIAKATGAESITLHIPTAEFCLKKGQVCGPVRVTARREGELNGAFGVIMPIVIK